jgi:RHS repeat-associated protein
MVQFAVSVTPKGSPLSQPANTNGLTVYFTVKNTGTCPDTFNLAASASGPITVVTLSPGSVPNLQPGASQQVAVTYNVGAAGSGTLTLTGVGVLGSESDSGSYNVTVLAPVAVTPDGGPALVAPGAGLRAWFTAINGKSGTGTYTFSVTCAGVVTCGSAPPAQSFNPYETRDIGVSYSVAGAVGATGTLTLRATDQSDGTNTDAGSFNVTVAPQGPVVERDLCLTIAAGAAAAFQCGDLRLVHALPGVRTLNAPRAPTLVYNSQHAHPYPFVTSDVTLPPGDPLPDSVVATLTVGGTQYGRRAWAGTQWTAPGQARRVVVGFDADTFATGLYDYTLTIQRRTGASFTTLTTNVATLPIVSRKNSVFGAGWWLAGYEKLYFNTPSGQVIWVGGDGSLRRYDRAGVVGMDTAYLATPVDHPDTLLHTSANQWSRLLPGGSKVTFTSNGTHRRTTNRLGYRTEFYPDSLGDWKLLRIQLPPDTTVTYDFTYAGSPSKLATVSVRDSTPGVNRVTALTWVGDSLRVKDFSGTPDSAVVVFQYQTGGTNRIIGRRNRRRTLTTFTYDAGFRLASSRLGVPGADSIILSFCAADIRGLAACSPSLVVPESAYTILDGPRTDSADVIHFWVDRFGAPSQIRDPYGNITTLTRADARWPALATRVQHPNAWILGATYDARGHIASSTDSSVSVGGKYATTRYTWDQRWDEPTQITLPQGEVTQFTYDATTGNRLWQQDIRGQVSRVTFTYYTSGNGNGLVQKVTLPGGAVDSIGYDARGNLAMTRSPLGWLVYTDNDRLGRPIVVRTQEDSGRYRHDSTVYDVRSRVIRTVAVGPKRAGVDTERVSVRHFYNDENQLDSLQRWTVPDPASIGTMTTQWRYDAAGRTVAEVAPDGAIDSTRYDPAGNAIAVVPRRGTAQTMTMIYDRLNRVRRRSVPPVTYPTRSQGIGSLPYIENNGCCFYHTYPWYALDPSTAGPTVPADVATFDYNVMGNLVRADNGDAFVRRGYYPNGLIKSDTLKILTYATRDSTKNVYVIEHRYDLNGRQTVLKHPWELAPRIGAAVADSVRYTYDTATGAIATVIDPLGARFTLTYNYRGERIRLALPGGITDSLDYDPDGRLAANWVKNCSPCSSPWPHPDALLRQTTLTYVDAERVYQAANAWGYRDTVKSSYSGLGHLAFLQYMLPTTNRFGRPARAYSSERFTLDPLANVSYTLDSTQILVPGVGSQNAPSGKLSRYYAVTGRLRAHSVLAAGGAVTRRDTILYDPAGNTEFSYQSYYEAALGPLLEDRASFYGADGKLRVTEYRTAQSNNLSSENWEKKSIFEEYRYDALGRRVMARTRRHMCGRDDPLAPCQLSAIRRTVWDGNLELYEIRMPAGDTASAATMDNDTLSFVLPRWAVNQWDPNPQFGRVAYTYGSAIDQPLSVTRINYRDRPWWDTTHVWAPFTVAPHWNWRGHADYGTFGDGGTRQCIASSRARCVGVRWRVSSFAIAQEQPDTIVSWWGSLVESKEEGSGLLYRRNRYVDPATGRFTQEDPIGLAGGLNLYGFANGDPVNFSDPFGLCPPADNCPRDQQFLLAMQASLRSVNRATAEFAVIGPLGGAIGAVAGAPEAAAVIEAVEGSRAGQFAAGFAKGFAAGAQGPGTKISGVTGWERAGIWIGKGAGWAARNPEKIAALLHRLREMFH